MAAERRHAAARRRNGISDQEIFQYLAESDGDFSCDHSDSDPTFEDTTERNREESSSPSSSVQSDNDDDVPAPSPVLSQSSLMPRRSRGMNSSRGRSRYFTTIKLCEELRKLGFNAAGTIMRNRIPKDCVMEDEKIFMKKTRGSSEVKYRDDEKLAVTRWMDNKPVVMLSTFLTDKETTQCERWSKKNKNYESVTMPEVIKHYNSNMGGFDLMDRMLAICPSRNRTKKWTIRVISHMVDLVVVNSYLQFKEREKKKVVKNIYQLREFKLELGTDLIVQNEVKTDSTSDNSTEELRPKHKRRKALIKPIPSLKCRRQQAKHLPKLNQKRCRKEGCYKKTTVYCEKCEIYLCFTTTRNCYTDFHTV